MTQKEFNEIFAKECIRTSELVKLFDTSESGASIIMGNIKLKYDRLNIRGKCHVLDCCDYFRIPYPNRYNGNAPETEIYIPELTKEDKRAHLFISPREDKKRDEGYGKAILD